MFPYELRHVLSSPFHHNTHTQTHMLNVLHSRNKFCLPSPFTSRVTHIALHVNYPELYHPIHNLICWSLLLSCHLNDVWLALKWIACLMVKWPFHCPLSSNNAQKKIAPIAAGCYHEFEKVDLFCPVFIANSF